MLDYFPFITALFVSSLAAAYDLKTTEIPDRFPYSMILIGLAYYLFLSISQNNFYFIINSVLFGLIFLGIGFLLYYFGQWGGGDAKLLGAIGFLLPIKPENAAQTIFPFPLSFFINLFLIGSIYMLLYSFVYSIINRKIINNFLKEIKASVKILLIASISFLSLTFILAYYFLKIFFIFSFTSLIKTSFLSLLLSIIIFVVWKFARVAEKGFIKKIHVSKLKVGDVIADSKYIEGIDEKELRRIKKSGKKFVNIKEGVRFGPAFPLAILFTFYFGDLLFSFSFLIF